jgi:hypothetical protein
MAYAPPEMEKTGDDVVGYDPHHPPSGLVVEELTSLPRT